MIAARTINLIPPTLLAAFPHSFRRGFDAIIHSLAAKARVRERKRPGPAPFFAPKTRRWLGKVRKWCPFVTARRRRRCNFCVFWRVRDAIHNILLRKGYIADKACLEFRPTQLKPTRNVRIMPRKILGPVRNEFGVGYENYC